MVGNGWPLPAIAIAGYRCSDVYYVAFTSSFCVCVSYVLHTEKFHDIDTVCFVESHVCT